MIQIVFSLTFDDGAWTGGSRAGSGRVGQVSLGELGLLDLLETQLGLKQPETPLFQRKVDYLQALRAADDHERFYSNSLGTDPMAVTEHLLKLRDGLIEANWGKSKIANLKKLNDLCEVEKHFHNKSGVSDRLVLVQQSLSRLKSFEPIQSVAVVDAKESLSAVWTRIITQEFPRLGVVVKFIDPPSKGLANPKSDLGKLIQLQQQKALPEGDDSLTILKGRDPWEAARFVASYLHQKPKETLADIAIIAPERQRGILLTALLAQGIPFGGNHSEVSYSRPALQIVILALALSWEPKDPSVALSLLTIEGSPVPKTFRYALIRSLNDSLAVGAKTWTEALNEITNDLKEKAPTSEEKEKVDIRKERVSAWFSAPAFPFEQGIPLDKLISKCSLISNWLRQRWGVSQQSSFREAHELCELLANLAKNLGEGTISRERMIHLLIDSVGEGISAEGTVAQAGGPRIVSHPGNIAESVSLVVWWDFSSATVRGHQEQFFSLNEIEELKKEDVLWPDPEDLSIAESRHWKTPFMRATKSVLLVTQLLDSNGNPDSLHPVWSELLPKQHRQNWMPVIYVNLLEKYAESSQRFLKQLGAIQEKEAIDSFDPRPLWSIQKNSLSLREAESASSLEQLLGCELAYVLKYHAGLEGEDRSSLKYDARIMGIIAHEVISLIFRNGNAPKPDEAAKAARSAIDDVIKDKAPQLFQKERSRELAELKRIILQDVDFYAIFLNENKLTIEAAELDVKKSEKTLAGVHLVGKIDHVLASQDSNRIVMDHKWGSAKYKERDLNEGKSLQLALYSKLISGAKDPTLAYHMISENKILVLNSDLKRTQHVRGPEARETLSEAEAQLKKKVAKLSSGELQAPGLQEDNASERFEAPCKYCEFTRICGLAWKEES